MDMLLRTPVNAFVEQVPRSGIVGSRVCVTNIDWYFQCPLQRGCTKPDLTGVHKWEESASVFAAL